jgi:hypothetical protein
MPTDALKNANAVTRARAPLAFCPPTDRRPHERRRMKGIFSRCVIAAVMFVGTTGVVAKGDPGEDCQLGERYYQLARDSLADSDEEQAAVRLARATTACSRFEYFMALGRVLMDSLAAGDQATAVDVFISAHDIAQTDMQRAAALEAYATLLAREGDALHALNIVSRARQLEPANPEISRLEASIKVQYEQSGDQENTTRRRDESLYRPLTGPGEAHSATLNVYRPWPPEEASWHVRIDLDLNPPFRSTTSLFEVEQRLSRALRDLYPTTGLYSAPNGFVMVTRIEAINADGVPLEGGERYRLPDGEQDFSLMEYVRGLFLAPTGYYRFIAFVVSDQLTETGDTVLSEDEALQRLRRGALRLPLKYKDMLFTQNHRIDALIYEFRMGSGDSEIKPLLPGRIPVAQHLANSGISVALFE